MDTSSEAVSATSILLSRKTTESENLTPERVSALAYSIWQSKGCPVNSADEDLVEAVQQVEASNRTKAARAGE